MSKIPRPSPRTYRDLPITDDEKRAIFPKMAAGRPKEEKKKPKQWEKTAISNAALPSTSKESAISSKARQRESLNRLKKTTVSNVALPSTSKESAVSLQSGMDGALKRSKTEPAIERDNVPIQTNVRITRSQANKASNLQPAVHAVKKEEVAKGTAKLRLRLSFRDKRPKEPKRGQSPSNSKKQLEKAATSDTVIPTTSKEPAVSLESTIDTQCETLNRSKTESAIELDHASIQRNERISTLQAKQASNLQQAVVKGEVPKGAAKLKQRLSFRDRKPIKEPRRKQTPINSEKQLEKAATSNAAIPSTSIESALSLESTIDRKIEALTRSKTESAIELDNVSIRRNGRITTLQANQATNLQPAVHGGKKDEVPKGAAKVKQRLSFRDKKPREPGISKIKSNTGNADNITTSLKNRNAESFKVGSDQVLKNQDHRLNRSKTESSINLEKVTKRTNANKITQIKQQINKPSKEMDKQAKPLDNKDDISPKLFEENAQNESPLQAEFCSPREVAHSGLKFILKPRKKSMSLNFNLTRCNSSQISNGDHDSAEKLPKEELLESV